MGKRLSGRQAKMILLIGFLDKRILNVYFKKS
jgi:hypothetical protein